MPRRSLGRTGVEVTIVGVGCAWLGRLGAPGQERRDDTVGVATIDAAVAAGVRLLDTAPLYMGTDSERLVARALRERTDDSAAEIVVETKVGHVPAGFDYSYDMAMRCVEGSLERLERSYLPLVYIHDAPAALFDRVMAPDGTLTALRKLQAEGVIGHIGTASNDPADNVVYVESGEFAMAVVPDAYSLLNQVALERIFPAAERLGMGVVVAVPLEKGLLATGTRGGQAYPGRHFSPEVLAHVGQIEAVCARHGVSLLAAALQFCLRHPVVTTVIPGARTPAEARANALAAVEPIPEAFWEELQPLVRTWAVGEHR